MPQPDDEIAIDADIYYYLQRDLCRADFGADAHSDPERESHSDRLCLCG